MRKALQLLALATLCAGVACSIFGGALWYWSWRSQVQARQAWVEVVEGLDDSPARPGEPTPAPPPPGHILARMVFPRLGVERFVVNGASDWDLASGPGWLAGTAVPGMRGNCIIAGHRDTHFRMLKDVREGDRIEVEYRHHKYSYRVTGLSIVKENDTTPLRPRKEAVLTLVTCYPFTYLGHAPRRYIVRAALINGGNASRGDRAAVRGAERRLSAAAR